MRQARVKPSFKKDQKDSQVTEVFRYYHFLSPKFWPTWLGIGGLYCMAWLPWSFKLGATRLICRLVKRFVRSRYNTLTTNINLCFPHLSDIERADLVEQALFSNILGFFETAHAWCRGTRGINIEFEGLEHYENAHKDGRGILVLSGHWSMLDMGAAIFGSVIRSGTIYRKHDNPLFNYFMTRSREQYIDYTLARKDVKGMIRKLRGGENLAYLPDQDFGRKRSIFVPFLNVETATITMTSQIAEAGNALVLPVSVHRKGMTNNYVLKVHPLLDIPSEDHERDTLLWTAWLEECVTSYPDQYLWLHKRFKTRPEGEPSVYTKPVNSD
jgi:KDO2-lipid IV(A) lauroyltransferase